MGILGIIIFIIIVTSFKKLLKNNESGFLHLLMSFMFICWMPIPFVIYLELKTYSFLFIGALFGTVSLIIYVITMVLQASHLSYSARTSRTSNENKELWRKNDDWMLNGLLGSQAELLAGFLKGVWSIFLTIAFCLDGQILLSILGIIYSLFTIMYLFKLLDTSLIKETNIFKIIPINTIMINFETSSWFLILLIWLVTK
ncbi:hypothetical protein [Abyssisolibacter fermentans]|uniref:hypothetical protein n=1 Tax=Abyssisolibacter fermentans TaxID=1766203 RepID=UPI00082FD8BA|nr:hypothetical protein [Abyssisolibacter fermentans]